MFTRPIKPGFARPAPHAEAPHQTLPALIATLSLVFSIAAVLTAVTLATARAAHPF